MCKCWVKYVPNSFEKVIKGIEDPSETLDNKGEAPHDFINKTQRLVNDDGPSYETKDQPLCTVVTDRLGNAAEHDYFSMPKICSFWFYNK